MMQDFFLGCVNTCACTVPIFEQFFFHVLRSHTSGTVGDFVQLGSGNLVWFNSAFLNNFSPYSNFLSLSPLSLSISLFSSHSEVNTLTSSPSISFYVPISLSIFLSLSLSISRSHSFSHYFSLFLSLPLSLYFPLPRCCSENT